MNSSVTVRTYACYGMDAGQVGASAGGRLTPCSAIVLLTKNMRKIGLGNPKYPPLTYPGKNPGDTFAVRRRKCRTFLAAPRTCASLIPHFLTSIKLVHCSLCHCTEDCSLSAAFQFPLSSRRSHCFLQHYDVNITHRVMSQMLLNGSS